MPDRPSARQIVRDDAKQHGWRTYFTPSIDFYDGDPDIEIRTYWQTSDYMRVCTGSMLSIKGKTTFDQSPLSIVHAREWLRMYARIPSREKN